MKKAVIEAGGSQHLVAEGDELTINFLGEGKKKVEFTPVMIVDGNTSVVEATKLGAMKVSADVITERSQGDKVVALRYKAKKRVHTKRGHRQSLTTIKIQSIK